MLTVRSIKEQAVEVGDVTGSGVWHIGEACI